MKSKEFSNKYTGQATYQIKVQGMVDFEFINRIRSLSVSHTQSEDGISSTLTGNFQDQEALSGLLNTLVDYRYSILSVTKMN